MRRQRDRELAILGCLMAIALSGGCATTRFEPSAAGPGVPRVSNFRIEPREVIRGGQVTLRFDFRDLDGDIMDVYLGVRGEVRDFTFATGLRPTVISRGRYFGQTEGTAEETINVRMERRFAPLTSERRGYDGSVVEPEVTQQEIGGIRVYEVFIVDRRGQVSNHLRARVTVR
ncbi:MAG: hypothetical protein ACE5I9_11215 [Candidatus Methylomirabilales bacterium]